MHEVDHCQKLTNAKIRRPLMSDELTRGQLDKKRGFLLFDVNDTRSTGLSPDVPSGPTEQGIRDCRLGESRYGMPDTSSVLTPQ